MADVRDLLVEIGTEELPPKALMRLSEAFQRGMGDELAKAGIASQGLTAYATPRRLAVLAHGLSERQADSEVQRRGPALAAAFDSEGQPTRAALGFARSCGVSVDQLAQIETEKGRWLAYRVVQPGRSTDSLVPSMVTAALAQLPIPKRMRWGDLSVEFVRPVHWVVLLFGDQVIDAEILGIRAGRVTRGHRFHRPGPLEIGHANGYAELLEEQGHVLAAFDQRRDVIRAQVAAKATELGGRAVIDPELLDEVTSLVEWPVALAGSFESRYLEIPAEALVATMKNHQKYFHLVDDQESLMAYFIAIANIDSRDMTQVRAGNERVIRPRLADAEFFWTQDRKQTLASRMDRLGEVVFQEKLGSLQDKSRRVAALAAKIAGLAGSDPALATRAAELSKCDLLTEMVGEFPELQGIAGRYYAAHDGESEEVAAAMDEQYLPRFAGDQLPSTATGRAVALADRLDTLVGIFGLGQSPTGDKDPFALRRAAVGVLRIMIEARLELDLADLLEAAAGAYEIFEPAPVAAQVFDFMMERLRAYYQETGVAPDSFESVLATRPTRPLDFDRRARAVSRFRELPQAASLAAANKRIHNILKKAGGRPAPEPDPALLMDPAEKALASELQAVRRRVEPMLDAGGYSEALSQLADLREAVDRFFDEVLVMSDDERLRANRLALLNGVSQLFMRTADISRLQA